MKALVHKKALAISLRKQGFSYKDILAQVPVAKSSLSLWLKDLPLTKSEKKSLKDRLDSNISRGRIKAASVLHQNRLDREKEKLPEIISHFKKHSSEPLFQLGIGLYWAEGAKNSGTFMFTNSDVKMVEMMLLWIEKYTPYTRHFLRYRLYIHKPYEHERCEVQPAHGAAPRLRGR